MAGASEALHEDPKALRPETIDRHRAIVSLMEELEAVDWYDQRVEAATDDELREILAHNRDEEKEHAAMVLEWLRRSDGRLDEELRNYLFRDGAIVNHEGVNHEGVNHEGAASGSPADAVADGSLGIGSLKGGW
jgi:uncharacterized protein